MCDFYGIQPLFSIFHKQALELLKNVTQTLSVVKIASRTLSDDMQFCFELKNNFKRVIASTGMKSIEVAKKEGFEADYL